MQASRGSSPVTRQIARRLKGLTRFVAFWFALALTAAAASPLIQPRALEVICSASGVFKLVVQGADGSAADHDAHRSIDCALCLPTGAPPPASNVKLSIGIDGSTFESPAIASPPGRRLALAPPPRGPPSIRFA